MKNWLKKLWQKMPDINTGSKIGLAGIAILMVFYFQYTFGPAQPGDRNYVTDPHVYYTDVPLNEVKKAILAAQENGSRMSVTFFHFQGGPTQLNPKTKQPWSDFVELDDLGTGLRANIHGPDEEALKAMLQAYPRAKVKNSPFFGKKAFWDSVLDWLLSANGLSLLIIISMMILASIARTGAGGARNLTKSKAKLLTKGVGKVTFADVAGVDEARDDLQEIVDFLRDPVKFQRLGGRVPRGVLLVGPPGTGKTLLARAIAGEAGVPFFSISGSDFVEMFVGVGAGRVRDMFEQAKQSAPCIIFVDEIDALGRTRNNQGGGNDEREQTLNQLLVEMDGFEPNENVILIAATNRPDVLDQALTRPGRFDRQIQVPNPDTNGRLAILQIHGRKVPLDDDVDLNVIARGTPGFSGADLMNLVNEAALLAARRSKTKVQAVDFDDSKDKILMGATRRNIMTEKEKQLTAYHEGGHAVMTVAETRAHPRANIDPIHKATIVPRGRALGVVQQLPNGDRNSASYQFMLSTINIAMGGRAAEEVVFGPMKVTSGAESDLKQATTLARRMFKMWGFSKKLGPVALSESYNADEPTTVSEDTRENIDLEIKDLCAGGLKAAKDYLSEHRDVLERMAQALLEFETLTGHEVERVFDGLPIRDQADKAA
jgi:cell division protease FtsH